MYILQMQSSNVCSSWSRIMLLDQILLVHNTISWCVW